MDMDAFMTNIKRRYGRACFAALIFALAPLTAKADPLAPPDFEEDWFVVTLQDQPCGYMHALLRTVGDEVHSDSQIQIEMRRGKAVVKINVDQNYRETPDGRPLGFKSVTSLGTIPEVLRGTIEGDQIKLVTKQFGVEHKESYPFDPEIRFAWGQLLAQRRHGLKPDDTYTVKTYEPSLKRNGPLEVTFAVHDKEPIEVLGKKRMLTRITTSLKIERAAKQGGGAKSLPLPAEGMQVDSDSWVDDEMNPIVTTVNLGFARIKMYKTSKADALKRGAPPEMFLTTIIPVNRRIGPTATRVKLRLRLKDGVRDRLPTLPETSMQHFERISDREGILTVRRLDWDAIRKAVSSQNNDPQMRQYLSASAVCDAGDSRIRRLSRRAVRGQKTPAEKADALRKFVTDYITDKNLDVGFATASEVARNRSGDCTEHGVLLAALARAAGLPARGVTGLVEVPAGMAPAGDASAFGFHMWTQVYIDGQWVDIDAAMRQTDCQANHIAISLVPLGNEGLMNTAVSLIPLLGQLDIKVLDVQR